MKQWFVLLVMYSSLGLAQNPPRFVQRPNSFAVFGGMSIDVVAAPGIVGYINSESRYAGQPVDDLTSAPDFFVGIEFPVGKEWGIKTEHTYLFKSYTFLGNTGGTYDFFYSVQAPSVLVQKIISGEGYFLKFGAGGGYHFGSAEQKISTFGTMSDYSAEGIGLKAEMAGQTAFDENFFGYISGHLGWEFLGELKDTATRQNLTRSNDVSEPVRLNYFFAGIRFGFMYYL